MEKMNLNGQINGGAADARKNFAEIYSNIISKYYNELVEDDGRSEIRIDDGCLDPDGDRIVGYAVYLRLGNKRNGYRRVKEIIFTAGIKGRGEWKCAGSNEFHDAFLGDYFDGLFDMAYNFEIAPEVMDAATEQIYKNISEISYGENVWQGHKWHEMDEYDMFSFVLIPSGVIPKLWQDRVLNTIGRDNIRHLIGQAIVDAAKREILRIQELGDRAYTRLYPETA